MYLQGSRKKGCKAHISIVEFKLYPEYSIKQPISPGMSQNKVRKIREESLSELRKSIESGNTPLVKNNFFVSLPAEEAHHKCHPTKGIMGFSQKVHPELIAKIQEFVSIGTIEPVEVQRLLKHHVKHYMCVGNLPDPNDRAYYPSLDDIRNHVAKAKRALQLSVVDQENVQKLIEQQQKLSPDSRTHFRPYKCAKSDKDSQANDKFEQTLLWVHQEPWQQQLMITYGNTMCLMDATYKTTRYDLPLFFICVRTNAGYCVVAEFIVQSESATNIIEALQLIMSWNPQWKPQFFMTDCSEAEISALESCFPNTTVYLCDFHREQAWERWTKDHKHGLNPDEGQWLLDQLRNCAWAPSACPDEGVPTDHHFQQAVKALQSSNLWKTNDDLRQWLNGTWLKMSKVYVHVLCVP